MNIRKRLELVSQIGRYLQQEYTTADINAILTQYGVQNLSDEIPDSKWSYVKNVLRHTPGDVVYQIAQDCEIDLSDFSLDEVSINCDAMSNIQVSNSGTVIGFSGVNNGNVVINNHDVTVDTTYITKIRDFTVQIDRHLPAANLHEQLQSEIHAINEELKSEINKESPSAQKISHYLGRIIASVPESVAGNLIATGILHQAQTLIETLPY